MAHLECFEIPDQSILWGPGCRTQRAERTIERRLSAKLGRFSQRSRPPAAKSNPNRPTPGVPCAAPNSRPRTVNGGNADSSGASRTHNLRREVTRQRLATQPAESSQTHVAASGLSPVGLVLCCV